MDEDKNIMQVFDVAADDLATRILLLPDGEGWKTETRFSPPRGHANIWRMQVDRGDTAREALCHASLSSALMFDAYDPDGEFPQTLTLMPPHRFISADEAADIWGPDVFIQEARL